VFGYLKKKASKIINLCLDCFYSWTYVGIPCHGKNNM